MGKPVTFLTWTAARRKGHLGVYRAQGILAEAVAGRPQYWPVIATVSDRAAMSRSRHGAPIAE
jgi:hypothetical protein